ncbi:MAG: MFS transporter [Armatimonadota bacterium]|nr:MFS transporter [Armatimonadota bacterium]
MVGRRSLGWQLGLSAYWFAVSMKWFILLTAVLPGQVEAIYGSEQKAQAWGGVVMIGAIWALIGPGLFGHFSDRIGKWRPFLAVGATVSAVAFFALFQATSIIHLILGYLLLQIGDDLAQGPYASLIPGLVEPDQRGRASGIMGLLMMGAQIVGGVGAMIFQSSLASIYMFIGGATILCALITLFTVRENPPKVDRPRISFIQGWIEPWKSPDFRWVWFTRFANAVGFYLIYNYLRYFLADVVGKFEIFGFEVASIGSGSEDDVKDAAFKAVFLLAMIISIFGAIGAVSGGRLADKVGRKRTVYLSGALMALPVIPFVLVTDFTTIALLAIPFAIGYGAYQASDWALAADVMPDKGALAKDMGIWQSCVAAPQIISGGLGVAVTAGNRASMGLGYSLAFGAAAAAFAVAVLFVTRIRGST